MIPKYRNQRQPDGEVRHRFIIALCALNAIRYKPCSGLGAGGFHRREECPSCVAGAALDRIDRRAKADGKRVIHELDAGCGGVCATSRGRP